MPLMFRILAALIAAVSVQAQTPRTSFRPSPRVLTVATLSSVYDMASITGVRVADFDRDGARDIAVAWFATDLQSYANNRRRLTIFYGDGRGGFARDTEIDLYIRNTLDPLSIFRYGTADLAAGDFDGDGDIDLAVPAFFGDELWLIENLGSRTYAPHLKYPFGFNSTGNSITPPETAAADLDGDGRDELIYLPDPLQRIQGFFVHIWRTGDTISNMTRVTWDAETPIGVVNYTWSFAVADFDGDDRPDICFAGTTDFGQEIGPTMVLWHGLDSHGLFRLHTETPPFVVSDLAPIAGPGACPPSLVLGDREGTQLARFDTACSGAVDFWPTDSLGGFSGSPNRGIAVEPADLNADGLVDLVIRQKGGAAGAGNLVEIAVGTPNGLVRVDPNPLISDAFANSTFSDTLRPRNLAVADLMGNSRPEIVAGFGPSPSEDVGFGTLDIAIWENGCRGDVNGDGATDLTDLTTMIGSMACQPDPRYRPEADLDGNGCIDLSDIATLLADFGCDQRN